MIRAVFTLDDRFRGLPAQREQVLSLHLSLNSPHLAIPGKAAGLATAYIASLRGAQGAAVSIY
ncbi:hypothetical protein, partial [Klebsiella pneumoniae]|uniref:hypothetical protein n=1 Tax=Klebsiella pneumoniae TaxID=573 RepID=UPI003F5212DD